MPRLFARPVLCVLVALLATQLIGASGAAAAAETPSARSPARPHTAIYASDLHDLNAPRRVIGAAHALRSGRFGVATESEPAIASDLAGATCSFAPDTQVVMADGTTKPIKDVHVGDNVEAGDPANGKEVGGRTVAALHDHEDRDLVDVSLTGRDGRLHTIHTTARHPFWDDTVHTWVAAARLAVGSDLLTIDGRDLPIAAVTVRSGAAETMLNLTVDGLHTFYVQAGGEAVLVHNVCLPGPGDFPTKVVNTNMAHAAERAVEHLGFDDVASARGTLQQLGASIDASGFPAGTIADTNPGRVLVPFGDGGYDVYQVGSNGNAILKTVLIAR